MTSPNAFLSKRWFEEVWNERRTETIDELLTPQSIGHMETRDVVGIDAFKQFHSEFLSALPDLNVRIEALVADGDNVVVRWKATGTHTGNGFGSQPTHQNISFRGMTWHRFQNGKIIEGWDNWNEKALEDQIRGERYPFAK